jgi:hypothetical protein
VVQVDVNKEQSDTHRLPELVTIRAASRHQQGAAPENRLGHRARA